ncbi:MAG: hypothetical protein R3B82_03790 [Sandaracinaceae bacterium]
MSRRDLTRAAMFAGAALATGCGGGETEAGGGDATSGGDDQGGGDATSGGGGGGQGGDEELSPCQIDPRRCRSSSPACDDCPVPPYGAPAVDVIV